MKQKLKNVEIILMNLHSSKVEVNSTNFRGVVGDARNMHQFKDKEFDVVFSNSVIEYVGNYNDQLQMAKEVMRVGKRYFIQTPNLYFPIEPHFVFPLFQFLPLELKTWLITNFDLRWHKKVTDRQKAREVASSVRLLNKGEVMALFPNANLFEEKIFGLTKSFIVCGGEGCDATDIQLR